MKDSPVTTQTVLPVIFFPSELCLTVRKNNGLPLTPQGGQKANERIRVLTPIKGTVADHFEVSPLSNPSAKILAPGESTP